MSKRKTALIMAMAAAIQKNAKKYGVSIRSSEFRKLPKSKNFFLVLKYGKTMRKILGVTK